jgi:hypothetical protein
MACENCQRNARLADRITQLADSIVVGGLELAGVPSSVARRAPGIVQAGALAVARPKRKPTKNNLAFAKAFKSVQGKYKKKNGGWKKDGFKNAAAAARRMIK